MTEVSGAYDFFAFGMLMPGRTVNNGYRYGFNGMEMDDEIKSYTTDFRQYDPRLARWFSIDPLYQNYPWQSPYVAFNNNPVYFRDPTGLEGESPEDQKVIKSPDASYINIPAEAKVEFFSSRTVELARSSCTVEVSDMSVKEFTVGKERYVATFNTQTGEFSGYAKGSDLTQKFTPEAIIYENKVTSEFKEKLLAISFELGHDPNKLMAVMNQETGGSFSPTQRPYGSGGSGAVGLIQFTNDAITEINIVNNTNYSKIDLLKMTAVQQLDVVKLYYQTRVFKGKELKTIYDYGIATFRPAYLGKDPKTQIWTEKSHPVLYSKHRGMDSNADGIITLKEAGNKYEKSYVK